MFQTMRDDQDSFLAHNQFLLYNKSYHRARLAQWGTDYKDVGTNEHGLNPEQLWTLEPHPYRRGCFYIVNERHPQHRIANHKHDFIVYNGPHYDDQLFRFVSHDEGYYIIQSAYYPDDLITKYGVEDGQVSFRQNDREFGEQQLWRLVPRFRAQVINRELFHFDNRQGSSSITHQISVSTGIRRTSSSTITNQTTYKRSISAALGLAAEVLDLGLRRVIEYENELEMSFSQVEERNWSKTESITFTVPPGKNFKVTQRGVKFVGQFPDDTCTLLTSVKVFESETSCFDESESE